MQISYVTLELYELFIQINPLCIDLYALFIQINYPCIDLYKLSYKSRIHNLICMNYPSISLIA